MKQQARYVAVASVLLIWGTVALASKQQVAAPSATVTASIRPNPPIMDENVLDLVIVDSNRKPLAGLKLTASVAMTSMDMGTSHPPIKEVSPGHYQTKPLFLMNGPWRVTILAKSPAIKIPLDFEIGNKKRWAHDPISISMGTAPVAPKEPGVDVKPDSKPPTQNETPIPPAQTAPPVTPSEVPPQMSTDMPMTMHASSLMPELHERTSYVASGDENWDLRTGFGKNYQMVAMMFLMMVEGSGMEGMKMAVMNMDFGPANFTDDGTEMTQVPMSQTSMKLDAKLKGPSKVGENEVQLSLADATGKPITGAKIQASVAMTSMDMGTSHPNVKELGKGVYTVKAPFSMAGPWRVTFVVTTKDRQSGTFSFDFEAK